MTRQHKDDVKDTGTVRDHVCHKGNLEDTGNQVQKSKKMRITKRFLHNSIQDCSSTEKSATIPQSSCEKVSPTNRNIDTNWYNKNNSKNKHNYNKTNSNSNDDINSKNDKHSNNHSDSSNSEAKASPAAPSTPVPQAPPTSTAARLSSREAQKTSQTHA